MPILKPQTVMGRRVSTLRLRPLCALALSVFALLTPLSAASQTDPLVGIRIEPEVDAPYDRDRDYGRDRDYDLDAEEFPSRLSRPGSVVLDIDDEDPVFEHLDEVAYSRRHDLPRAAGQ